MCSGARPGRDVSGGADELPEQQSSANSVAFSRELFDLSGLMLWDLFFHDGSAQVNIIFSRKSAQDCL